MLKGIWSAVALCALALVCLLQPGELLAAQGKLEKIRVHGAALDGNLQGNDATRDVWVYTPPGYATGSKRYPVIYYLHGYAVTAEVYVKEVLNLPDAADEAMSSGAPQAIIVLPDAFTRFGGSFYSSSPTIGDWESFIAKDLPAYIDGHYRTLAKRGGRGLAGHSMGGYGTWRIGMKYPETFAALYAASAAIVLQAPDAAKTQAEFARLADTTLKSVPKSAVNGVESQASAWAPNPQKPPYFFDLPFDADGRPVPGVAEKWTANSLLYTVDQNVPQLKSFRAIAMDVGNEDGLSTSNTQFSDALTRLGVAHDFEVYAGNHGNRIGARFVANVLPFFAKHLDTK